jgi:hypothetical protein
MRLPLIIAATLAATACSQVDTGCPPGPEGTPFTLDRELTQATVDELLTQFGQTDPAELVCEDVCHALHGEDSDRIITQTDACTLTIDGDAMGDPAAIVGSLLCEGYASD